MHPTTHGFVLFMIGPLHMWLAATELRIDSGSGRFAKPFSRDALVGSDSSIIDHYVFSKESLYQLVGCLAVNLSISISIDTSLVEYDSIGRRYVSKNSG